MLFSHWLKFPFLPIDSVDGVGTRQCSSTLPTRTGYAYLSEEFGHWVTPPSRRARLAQAALAR